MMSLREYIDLVEGRAKSVAERLLQQYGQLYTWTNLPAPAKKAVSQYHVREHGAKVLPDAQFWYGMIPTKVLIAALMKSTNEFTEDFDSFEAYHDWYVGQPTKDHGKSQWAVLLDSHTDIIFDGWHRFHSYVRKGLQEIPAVLPISSNGIVYESGMSAARDGDSYFVMDDSGMSSVLNDRSRDTLVYMSPADFLLMAEKGYSDHKAATVARVMQDGAKFTSLPYLGFTHDGKGRAQVVGHEGRHRAEALMRLGVKQMPVVLRSMEQGAGRAIRWGRQNDEFDRVPMLPKTLHGEDGQGTIPMPLSVIFPPNV